MYDVHSAFIFYLKILFLCFLLQFLISNYFRTKFIAIAAKKINLLFLVSLLLHCTSPRGVTVHNLKNYDSLFVAILVIIVLWYRDGT